MRKMLSIMTVAAVLVLILSCSPNPGSSAGGQLMKDFQPEEFFAEGLTAYLSGRSQTGLAFTDSYATATATASLASKAVSTGTLIVDAIYTDYPYQDYIVSGTFVYELPVEDGVIQGYRVNSDKESAPTITNTASEGAAPASFGVTMKGDTLGPAYGTVSTSGTAVTSKSGMAAAILPGTDAVFTVGRDTITVDDILNEPYTKDQMPEDYLSMYQANGPITMLILEKIKETGSASGDLGNGNTFSVDSTNPEGARTDLNIVSPMHFNVEMNGTTYAVHSTGKMTAKGASAQETFSASMYFDNFAVSMTAIQGGSASTIQTKTITGTYSASMSGLNADITIGNHRYDSKAIQEMMALNMLNISLSMWHFSKTDAEGNYENYLGAEAGKTPLYITGIFDSADSTLDGILHAPYGEYTFTAKVRITGSGQSASAAIESLTFNGYTYSENSIKTFQETMAIITSITSSAVN